MIRGFRAYIATAVLVALWSIGQLAANQTSAQGQTVQVKRETARAISSVEGRDVYLTYCATCHGRTGHGDGPAAPALKVPLPDLTKVAARNGGKFDAARIEYLILGKSKVPSSHGDADMPIWGPVFQATYPDTAGQSLRIRNLMEHLKTIQTR